MFMTKRGIFFYNYQVDSSESNSISSNNIAINPQSIFEDSKGLIWIATSESGLSILNPAINTFKYITTNELDPQYGLTDDGTWSIVEDDEGFIWVGATTGLNKINPDTGEVTQFVHDPEDESSISPGWVYRILIDQEDPNTFWIGTIGGGLQKFDKTRGLFTQYLHPKGSGDDQIISMIEDDENNLWIGWFNAPTFKGLSIFDKDSHEFTDYVHDASDPSTPDTPQVFALYQDETGIIWVANNNGLVEKVDSASHNFKHYYHIPGDEDSISDNMLLSYYEDSRGGTMWFGGVSSGLIRYNKVLDTFKAYKAEDVDVHGISSNFVSRIFEDSEGIFYVAMRGGHVAIFDRLQEKVIKIFEHNPEDDTSIGTSDSVRYILEDRNKPNIMYMGSFAGGFHIYDKQTDEFRNFEVNSADPDGLTNNTIVHLHQDPYTSELWLSSIGGGLIHYNPETDVFKTYLNDSEDESTIGSNQVWEVKQYEEGVLWLATVGGGLNRFDIESESFKRYTKDDGFPANGLMTMQKDDDDQLWIGSDEGLIRFDMATETSKVFTKEDGLQGGDVFLDAASYYDSNKNMWFGGVKGLNFFNPREIIENDQVPRISLITLTQGNVPIITDKALSKLDKLEIPWQQNFFEFSFSALSYSLTEKKSLCIYVRGL